MFNNQSISVFGHDYETTGLNVDTLGVVQSALCFATLHQDGSFEVHEKDVALLNPGVVITAEASKIHGYTDIDVADKAPWEEYLAEQMITVNESAVAAVVGFNSSTFDNRIAARVGFKPVPSIDLIKAARRFKSEHSWESAKLTHAYEKLLGKPLEAAHDAYADVHATFELIAPAMKLAGAATLDEFMVWMKGDDGTPEMKISFGKHKGSKLKRLDRPYVEWLLSDKCEVPFSHELREGLRACL